MDQACGVTTCVGIDVSMDRLDVHLRASGVAFAVSRDGKGLENLAERLAALEVSLIVLEATGGFEVTVAAALAGAGLPLAVVNPRQIRDCARALAKLAKTDAIDAQVFRRASHRALCRAGPSRAKAACRRAGAQARRTRRPQAADRRDDRHGVQSPPASG
jgi:transposase